MLQSLADVEEIQVDLMWISRLNRLLSLAEHIVQLLGLILAIAVVLIVGNTIRLHIESRKSEILIIKLLGATDPFIRRPFLYLGFWYGLIGGVAAWALLTLVGLSLHPYLRSFLDTYGNEHSIDSDCTLEDLIDILQLIELDDVITKSYDGKYKSEYKD